MISGGVPPEQIVLQVWVLKMHMRLARLLPCTPCQAYGAVLAPHYYRIILRSYIVSCVQGLSADQLLYIRQLVLLAHAVHVGAIFTLAVFVA